VSHYQLTIEPNTAFYAASPVLPDEELAWDMQEACGALLVRSGFEQYEVSAWAQAGRECAHNLNYWRYGDYLGIGAGAHGKITLPAEQAVKRRIRVRHPLSWMQAIAGGGGLAEDRLVTDEERSFEFFLNQLRMRRGVQKSQFEARTGLDWAFVSQRVDELLSRGLAVEEKGRLVPTELGWRFSNESQAIFLP
jgi:coproporphyrinogen III oxidase-like Fe-S oxidoreductase